MSHTASHALILEGGDPSLRQKEGLGRAADWLCPEGQAAEGGLRREACGHCPVCRKALTAGHADLHIVDEGAEDSIKVESIRELRRTLGVRPLEGRQNCALILHAEKLTPAAQNALLEILEEPPAYTRVILCVKSADALLLTVRSRCVVQRLRAAGTEAPSSKDREQALVWIGAMDDDWERAVCSYAWDKLERDAFKRRIAALLLCLREAIEKGAGDSAWNAVALCREAWDLLQRNASVGIVCGLLALGKPTENTRR